MTLHRSHRHFQHLCNLFRRQVFLIAEDEGGALRLGQGGEQLLKARAEGRGTLFGRSAVIFFNLDPEIDTSDAASDSASTSPSAASASSSVTQQTELDSSTTRLPCSDSAPQTSSKSINWQA